MGNNANIERITFEEIQEFKDLDLFELTEGENPEELILLAYDPALNKFVTAILDVNPSSGNITINNDAQLTRDITVITEDLPVAKGFVFKKDTDFTEFVQILCNPSKPSILVLSATPTIIEVNTATPILLSYAYTQNDGGVLDAATLEYFRETVATFSGESTTILTESTITYNIFIDMLLSDQYAAEKLTDADTIRAIYPHFIGIDGSGTTPGALVGPLLTDIKTLDYFYADFTALDEGFTYYWFAVHTSNNPLSWAEVDSNGTEDFLNSGDLDTLFNYSGQITYKNNTYSVYMTNATDFNGGRIKIKF